jgi:excisionase family DNA binding protein
MYEVATMKPLSLPLTDKLEPLLVTVDESCQALRVSRSTLYALAREGKIELRRVGKSSRVTVESLRRFYEGLPNSTPGSPVKRKAEPEQLLADAGWPPSAA